VAVALPKSFSTAVLQITGQDPLVVEDLRTVNPFVADSLASAELRDVFQTKGLTSALSYQVMSEAAGLKEDGEAPKKPAGDGKTE
jgi:hypothetical protein